MDEQFDIANWRQRLGSCERRFGVVIGPEDAVALEAEQHRLLQEFDPGPAVPIDLFLWGIGESSDRRRTKLGGLPQFDKRATWPVDSKGNPLPFFAQFNFAQSSDVLLFSVPSPLLLIFANLPNESMFDVEFQFRWAEELPEEYLVCEADLPVVASFSPLYSQRWRTTAYPDAEDMAEAVEYEIDPDDYQVLRPYAAQIGQAPFMLSSNQRGIVDGLLACIPPMDPFGRKLAPMLNVDQELDLDNRGSAQLSGIGDVRLPTSLLSVSTDDTVYFYMDENREVEADWISG